MNIDRAKSEFEKHAKMPVDVRELGGAIYGFTEELGALRLYKVYNGKHRAGYSENLKTWYICIELN